MFCFIYSRFCRSVVRSGWACGIGKARCSVVVLILFQEVDKDLGWGIGSLGGKALFADRSARELCPGIVQNFVDTLDEGDKEEAMKFLEKMDRVDGWLPNK